MSQVMAKLRKPYRFYNRNRVAEGCYSFIMAKGITNGKGRVVPEIDMAEWLTNERTLP